MRGKICVPHLIPHTGTTKPQNLPIMLKMLSLGSNHNDYDLFILDKNAWGYSYYFEKILTITLLLINEIQIFLATFYDNLQFHKRPRASLSLIGPWILTLGVRSKMAHITMNMSIVSIFRGGVLLLGFLEVCQGGTLFS